MQSHMLEIICILKPDRRLSIWTNQATATPPTLFPGWDRKPIFPSSSLSLYFPWTGEGRGGGVSGEPIFTQLYRTDCEHAIPHITFVCFYKE